MDGLTLWHWLVFLLYGAVFVVPIWRIVGRAGFPGALSLLVLVPLVNLVLLWVFAFTPWPKDRSRRADATQATAA